MKILGVKFKNINTLVGEWEIRFDRSPISDTGLFAIVGPNGSGKTSILDAITLGLYGETARLRGPDTGILNLQNRDAYAEVTFSVMDKAFCSVWSVKKNGAHPEPPEMSLFSLNGEKTLLETRSIPVRNRIADLTGLDFKRFCRSILLAQGEFTAFLNALENERAEILEKIIGPEMLREMEEAIRTQAEVETERLHRLKEEAAGFQTPDSAQEDAIRQSMAQSLEDLRENDRDLERLRYLETWLERTAREPMAEQDAADALMTAEKAEADARKTLAQVKQVRPAGRYAEALAQVDDLKAKADAARNEELNIAAQIPDREEHIAELAQQAAGIRAELEQARGALAERSGTLAEAETLDRDIAALEARFLEKVSRLEAIAREQREASRMDPELEEQEKDLDARVQDLLQWVRAHAGEEALAAEIPAMESLLTQMVMIRQDMENCRSMRSGALKTEERSAGSLRHAQGAAQKARTRADRMKARKADRDRRLEAVFAGETQESLKAVIHHGLRKLAACKALVRIGAKASAFVDTRQEVAENQGRMASLTETLSAERSRLEALEEQIRHRDTVRRFDPERAQLQPGKPCPLCGASAHPFLENGVLDFSELDVIVREREEKIRSLQIELEALQSKENSLQARVKALEQVQGEWDSQCKLAGESWVFGDTVLPAESIRTVRKEIRGARSKLRSTWWYVWRAKRTDRSLGRKIEKLSKKESLLEQVLAQHEIHAKALAQIDDALSRLSEKEGSVRAELSGRFDRWQESLPEPGSESDSVARLRERSEHYNQKRREQAAAADELQALQRRKLSLAEALGRLEAESGDLSEESGGIQAKMNALKADRLARFDELDPVRERLASESRVQDISVREQSLSAEKESLEQLLAADRQNLQRRHDEAVEARNAAEAAEQDLLEQSGAMGFLSLNAIREGLSILNGEQEALNQLSGAEDAVAAAREALAALRPRYTTADSLETVLWKISDAVKRQKELDKDIENCRQVLEGLRQAELAYRELLQAIAVQERVYAEAVEARQGVPGQGQAGDRLHHLLLRHLLEETNRHLTSLSSGRYALRPGKESLGLNIQDALQAGALRSVKTLSGGESFLVSLCLALGLSDLAGRHRKIESLFLDEGFGVLDEEMLYRVMSALKGLRANGKTVGVVSHVQRLAQEIPTQIRLEKDPGGSSRITVVA